MSASFRQLDYQDRVLSSLEGYLDTLKEKKAQADQVATIAAQNPTLDLPVPDYAKQAWEALGQAGKLPPSRATIPFSPRLDGCGRPVPNAVLKVPTAGGKTWLAISSVSRIMGRYLDRNTGFVLWIVPNEGDLHPDLEASQRPPAPLPAGLRPRRRGACKGHGKD